MIETGTHIHTMALNNSWYLFLFGSFIFILFFFFVRSFSLSAHIGVVSLKRKWSRTISRFEFSKKKITMKIEHIESDVSNKQCGLGIIAHESVSRSKTGANKSRE